MISFDEYFQKRRETPFSLEDENEISRRMRTEKPESSTFEKLTEEDNYEYSHRASFDIIIENLLLPWSWVSISRRGDITPEIFEKIPVNLWDRDSLSSVVGLDFITSHKNFPWNYRILSRRRNLPMDFINGVSEDLWDWEELTRNSPKHHLLKFPKKPWVKRIVREVHELMWF